MGGPELNILSLEEETFSQLKIWGSEESHQTEKVYEKQVDLPDLCLCRTFLGSSVSALGVMPVSA